MASIVRPLILVLGLMLSGVCCLYNMVDVDKAKPSGETFEIILDVYSGREDPKWEIGRTSPFYKRIARAYKSVPSTELCKHLGYRGFRVTTTQRRGRKISWTVGCNKHRDLASLLLKSCPFSLPKAVRDVVRNGIKGKVPRRHEQPTKNEPKTMKYVSNVPCTTTYEPEVWNVPGIIGHNNCYNYATNLRTDTFAQPGRASGITMTDADITVDFVYEACISDGLTRLSGPYPGNECLIVLVIWPYNDFHFYRLDDDGVWSHKPGQTRVRNTDNSGEIIRDIESADHGPYTEFAGYLGVNDQVYINLTRFM